MGHLIEAAVAHNMATGKTNFLNVATRVADLLVNTFGPGKRTIWPGHQITEMALVRLYRLTGREDYLNLAKFLLDERGPGNLPGGRAREPARARVQPGAGQGRRPVGAGRPRRARDVHVFGDGRRRGPHRRREDARRRRAHLGQPDQVEGLPHRRHRRGRRARGVRQPLRAAEHAGLQRDLRLGRHGLLEPAAVPARRRRQVRGRDGADALQRPDLRRLARRQDLLLSQPARIDRPARAAGMVRRGLLPRQHHPLHGLGARLHLRGQSRTVSDALREPVCRRQRRHRPRGQHAEGGAGHALPVGRRGEDDGHAGHARGSSRSTCASRDGRATNRCRATSIASWRRGQRGWPRLRSR